MAQIRKSIILFTRSYEHIFPKDNKKSIDLQVKKQAGFRFGTNDHHKQAFDVQDPNKMLMALVEVEIMHYGLRIYVQIDSI